MNHNNASSPSNRTINKHSWPTALLLSIAVHGLVMIGAIWVWPSASSKGQGQVMLLEAVHEQTQEQPNTQARQTSAQSAQTNTPSKKIALSGQQQAVKPQSSASKPQQAKQLQSKASSSNQGDLVDQSGKAQTPQEQYQQQLLKHLLNKMGSAPVTGKANIGITLMPAGVAIQVKIDVLEGSPHYQQWLQSKVLNANPFPAIPKELGVSEFKTTIPIEHSNEPSSRRQTKLQTR
ncbi:cell envelope integrity protein TolA [Pseudomonas sp. HK3]